MYPNVQSHGQNLLDTLYFRYTKTLALSYVLKSEFRGKVESVNSINPPDFFGYYVGNASLVRDTSWFPYNFAQIVP